MEFCVVTGFFYIGREKWPHYNRSLEEYLLSFNNLLKLKVDMIIFTETKWVQFVQQIRSKISRVTRIIEKNLTDLEMYKHLSTIIKIQKSPDYAPTHPNRTAPEICQPLYNVVVCSKMDLVYQASKIWDYKYYVWIDAGFTHNSIDLSCIDWVPRIMFEEKKMTLLAIDNIERASRNPKVFFNQYLDVFTGNCFCLHKAIVDEVRDKYYSLIVELFSDNIKDDDQYYNTVFYQRYPSLVRVGYETWYYDVLFVDAIPNVTAVSLLWREGDDPTRLLENVERISKTTDYRIWVYLQGKVYKELYMSLLKYDRVWFRTVPSECGSEKAKLFRAEQFSNRYLTNLILQDQELFDERKVKENLNHKFKVIQKETLIVNVSKLNLKPDYFSKILDLDCGNWLLYLEKFFKTKILPIPIYVSHYSKLVDRKRNLLGQLENTGLDSQEITWVEQYDREIVSQDMIDKIYRYDPSVLYRKLSIAEIANALAHLHIIEKIVSTNIVSLILEDDIIFKPNFCRNLSRTIELLPPDWDIVCLGGLTEDVGPCSSLPGAFREEFPVEEIKVYRPQAPGMCTVSCYLLSPKGAKYLLSQLNTISEPIDDSMYTIGKRGSLALYWVYPWLAFEGSKSGKFATFADR